MRSIIWFCVAMLPACGAFVPAVGRSSVRAAPRSRGAARLQAMLGLDIAVGAALSNAPMDVSQINFAPSLTDHTLVLSAKEVKQGLYSEYEVEEKVQTYDNAKSTFATREKTAKGRNKYAGLFAVLLVGSFVIPMAQYFWYVRDDVDDNLFKK